MEKDKLIFFVNGVKIVDEDVDPNWTLLKYLREKLHLPGTKMGCSEGGCGACTVMVSKFNLETKKPEHFSQNACLAPICTMHGMAVTTVEGIGSIRSGLHPVQERLAKSHGSQCGFCTPGFAMSMYALLRSSPRPTLDQIQESLVGNLCRCTGYRPILEGFQTFATKDQPLTNGCGKVNCCQLNNKDIIDANSTPLLFDSEKFKPYNPSQDIIFPPQLQLIYESLVSKPKIFRGPKSTFYVSTTLEEMIHLKALYPHAKIVHGNTEIGIEITYKNMEYPVLIHPTNIQELLILRTKSQNGLRAIEIGSAVSIASIEKFLKDSTSSELPTKESSDVKQALLYMMKWFAGKQIKHVATMGGNIMTSSPISDLNPVLIANQAVLTFQSIDGKRNVKMDENFFTTYRKNIAKPQEVLVSILIPITSEDEYTMAYKQCRRRDDDIAIVNAAMRVKFQPCSLVVTSASLVFGGLASTTLVATRTMKSIIGATWNQELLETVLTHLTEELKLDPSAPGGMTEYRQTLGLSFFFKFFLSVRREIAKKYPSLIELNIQDMESLDLTEMHPPKSVQIFQNIPSEQSDLDPLGRPLIHTTSLQQTTGEAKYVDDISVMKEELFAGFVTSSHCHAKILTVDETEAMAMEGVVAFYSAKDLPRERNKFGIVIMDEEIFASSEVKCVGQIIGVVIADDQDLARKAASKVRVQYEDLPNPILSIEDAIKAGSFREEYNVKTGNISEGFRNSKHILEGETKIGGQQHFYMETQATIAYPQENEEMLVYSSTQNLTLTQSMIAKMLGITSNKVTVKVKRLGGGFGGKESRSVIIALPVTFAASKLNRPVRTMLNRIEDTEMIGTRHPFYSKWKIGVASDGKVEALEIHNYSNGGFSEDLSNAVIFTSTMNVDNTYKFKNMEVSGKCCITNMPSCTAFRGFGTVQALFIMEDIMTKTAEAFQLDQKKFREQHFYAVNGDTTHYGQELLDCNVKACWDRVIQQANYDQRVKKIAEFNRKNQYRKRGICVYPGKFPVSFEKRFLNQGAALVHIYLDGSVLITHGGTEMGQGLHTKLIQVASKALKISFDKVYISETSTDKVPNTTATAASVNSNFYGMAVIDSCNKLLKRLSPYKHSNPKGKWEDWVNAAYFDQISLSATGFYGCKETVEFDFKTGTGKPFSHFTYGSAVTEVEIDCLTGDHQVLRSDIVMDIGISWNPAIDVGQIEGAFVQGQGLFTMEEIRFSPTGVLLTKGPGSYKIPTLNDIPKEFNVTLLRESPTHKSVYSSKGVGEPPLVFAGSVFFAIKNAIKAANSSLPGEPFTIELSAPATSEKIRMACQDHITKQIKLPQKGSFTPWSITF